MCLFFTSGKLKIKDAEIDQRMKTTEDLALCISELFTGSKLIQFGSFCNGFGQSNSDLDLSLILNEDDCSEVLYKLISYESNLHIVLTTI